MDSTPSNNISLLVSTIFLFCVTTTVAQPAPWEPCKKGDLQAGVPQSGEWATWVSKAKDGYVVTLSHPPCWITGSRTCAVRNPANAIYIPDGSPETLKRGNYCTGSHISIGWTVLDGSKVGNESEYSYYTLKKIIEQQKIDHRFKDRKATFSDLKTLVDQQNKMEGRGKTFTDSTRRLVGVDAIYEESSEPMLYDKQQGKPVPSSGPNKARYRALLDGHIVLDLDYAAKGTRFGVQSIDYFKQIQPTFDKIIGTLKFMPISALGKDVIVSEDYESKVVLLSQRQQYRMDSSFSFALPTNWKRNEPIVRPAGNGLEQGELIVQFTVPGKDDENRSGKLIIMLKGMPLTALTKQDFLSAAERHVKAIIPEPKVITTTSAVFDGMNRLAGAAARHSESTGRTYITTYSGQDASGKEVLVKSYVAGGMTVVANMLFIADKKSYVETMSQVEKALRTLEVNLFSPSIRF